MSSEESDDAVPDNFPESGPNYEVPKSSGNEGPRKRENVGCRKNPRPKDQPPPYQNNIAYQSINITQGTGIHIGHNFTTYNYGKSKKPHKSNKRSVSVKEVPSDLKYSLIEVDKNLIEIIYEYIGEGWRELGKFLGYGEGTLDMFGIDSEDYVRRMLVDWIRTNPFIATVGNLAQGLWKVKSLDYDKVEKILIEHVKSSAKSSVF